MAIYRRHWISKRYISIERDKKLWNKIILNKDNALQEPDKTKKHLRPRGHVFELPLLRTERFKSLTLCGYK